MSYLRSTVFALALGWAGGAPAVAPGEKAPSCPLPAFHGAETLDPAAHLGQVVYLDFWASWCRPCAKSFPFLNQLHQDLQARGLKVIAVNLDETRADAEAFLRRYPAGFAVAADPEALCPPRYQVRGMPTSYLIDRRGRIREVHTGFKASDGPARRARLDALLAEEP